jgi:hypothetical protein
MYKIPYRTDPNSLGKFDLTVEIEYLAANVPDYEMRDTMCTVRVGRTLIVIEGTDEMIKPYLTAIMNLGEPEGGETNASSSSS